MFEWPWCYMWGVVLTCGTKLDDILKFCLVSVLILSVLIAMHNCVLSLILSEPLARFGIECPRSCHLVPIIFILSPLQLLTLNIYSESTTASTLVA